MTSRRRRPITMQREHAVVVVNWLLQAPELDVWPRGMFGFEPEASLVLMHLVVAFAEKLRKAVNRKGKGAGRVINVWTLTPDEARMGLGYVIGRLQPAIASATPLPPRVEDALLRMSMSMVSDLPSHGRAVMTYRRAKEILSTYIADNGEGTVGRFAGQTVKKAKARKEQTENAIATVGMEGLAVGPDNLEWFDQVLVRLPKLFLLKKTS